MSLSCQMPAFIDVLCSSGGLLKTSFGNLQENNLDLSQMNFKYNVCKCKGVKGSSVSTNLCL